MATYIPNAQGYQSPVPPQLSELFSAKSFEVLKDFYRKAPLTNICKFEYKTVKSIQDIPQKIIDRYFLRVPDNTGWEEFYNNAENKSQSYEMRVSHQNDGEFLRFRIKMSMLDYNRLMSNANGAEVKAIFNEWQDVIKEMAVAKLHEHLWYKMEDRIMANVNPMLAGSTAGFCGVPHNYGKDSSPVVGTPHSVISMLRSLKEDFIRGNIMSEMDLPYLKVPPAFIELLAQSREAQALIHHRTDNYASQFADYLVLGDTTGIIYRGVLLVPDYHMTPSPQGVYNIYGGARDNNLAKLYLTSVFMYPETTNGDQMIWMGMDAGFGCAVKRDDVSALIKMQIPNEV